MNKLLNVTVINPFKLLIELVDHSYKIINLDELIHDLTSTNFEVIVKRDENIIEVNGLSFRVDELLN